MADLTNKVFYFESSTSPNLIWTRLGDLDFSPSSGVRRLDLTANPDRIGGCTAQFEPAEAFVVGKPDLN